MRYLVLIQQTHPLTIHFSFYNSGAGEDPVYVPKLLTPLGFFVRIEVFDEMNKLAYRSRKPKIKLKLDPARAESYFMLEPNYAYGAMLAVDNFHLQPGDYQLHLKYSSLPFTGFPSNEFGELSYETIRSIHVE